MLDGGLALAIPTKKGQSLSVEKSKSKGIHWRSLDEMGAVWFEANFQMNEFVSEEENKLLFQLLKILKEAQKLQPDFLMDENISITTQLDFPRNWGLGTSSTLINNIAQWAQVDAFHLLKNSLGGSGYDIAAAQRDTPILYQLINGKPTIKEIHLDWNFKEHLFFVHLNQKQNSQEAISHYKSRKVSTDSINSINLLTQELLQCTSISAFEKLVESHENSISKTIQIPTVKDKLFRDYPRAIKSLGAWGGDFIMAVGTKEEQSYFRKKGFITIIPFEEMLK